MLYIRIPDVDRWARHGRA